MCTPEHPFYIPEKGWVNASDLIENDEVLLFNGSRSKIIKITREVLETTETTYNFEVEEYHTYYVGKQAILVHNFCEKEFADYYVKYKHGRVEIKAYHQANGEYKYLFIAADDTGHGTSAFKLLKETNGNKLRLIGDLDAFGKIMSKHSSNVGKLFKFYGRRNL